MNKRLATAFVVFSLLVFSFLIVWFVFRTINTRADNILSASEELERISRTVSSTYLSTGSFTSEYFTESVLQSIRRRKNLQALVITTTQIEFVYALTGDYFTPDFDFSQSPSSPVQFSISAISDAAISTFALIPSGEDIRLDAVFRVFGRGEVFPIVRELLIGLLSLLLIIAIIIILQPFLAARVDRAAGSLRTAGRTKSSDGESYRSGGAFRKGREPDVSAMGPAGAFPAGPASAKGTGRRVETGESLAAGGSVASEEEPEVGGLYSPETELVLEQHLEERLSAELKRAASFDQDLVLLLARVGGLRRSDPFYMQLSQMAREFFNFQDLCFEYDDGGIGIIIPNVDIDEGIERVEGFKNRVDSRLQDSSIKGTLSTGMSARNGRLISGNRIIKEAGSALHRAEKESSGIVAFRVDPEKYREYISSRKSSIQR